MTRNFNSCSARGSNVLRRMWIALFSFVLCASAIAANVTYEYDANGRLFKATYGPPNGAVVTYTYDANGNRISATTSNVTRGTMQFSASAYSGGEASAARVVTIEVQRTSGSFGPARVTYTTVNGSAVASGGSGDYTSTSGELVWDHDDDDPKAFTVTVLDDATLESTETLSVILSGAVGAALGTPASAVFSIADDELDPLAPSQPGTPVISAITGTTATATWAAASDNVAVTGYRYRLNSGQWQTLGNVLTVSLTGLTDGTSYNFEVAARDAAGLWGSPSARTFATPDTAAPTTPGTPVITVVSATQLDLTWAASTDNIGVARYSVERCSGSGCSSFSEVATPTTNTFSDIGLSAATSYSYRIRAVDAATNSSSASGTSSASTQTGGGGAVGLVAAYSFNAGSGTSVADSSGLSNNGTISGATWTTSGKFGSALSFDGVNDMVSVPDASSLDLTTGMTVEAWVYPAALSGWRTVVLKEISGDLSYSLYASSDSPQNPSAHIRTPGNWPSIVASNGIPVNTWSHLAVTYNGSTLRLYVNGTQAASLSASGSMLTSSLPLRIGGNTVWTEYFSGRIDEVRVYNRALTAAEITTDMNTPVGSGSGSDTQAPSTPSGLSATPTSSSQVNLSWTASTDNVGVTGYKVERCQGSGCSSFSQIAVTATNSYVDAGRAPNTAYVYQVRAYDAAGNDSSYSATAAATTPPDTTAPSTPTGLSATAISSTQIDLSWTASTDAGGSGLAGYRIYRCQGENCSNFGAPIATAVSNTYADSGRSPNTVYRYRIRAYDSATNESTDSAIVSATTSSDTIAPDVPGGLSVNVVSSEQLNVTWNAVTDAGGSGLAGYKLERCQAPSCTFIEIAVLGSAVTSFANTGLAPNTTYTYRVRAYDNATPANQSGYASASGTTPADTTQPTQPTALVATAPPSGSQIHLEWVGSADSGGSGLAGYRIERCTGSGCMQFSQIATTTTNTFDNGSLGEGVTHVYRVLAVDGAGNVSTPSNQATATTPDMTRPTPPTSISFANVTATSATVNWSGASDSVGITGYQYRRTPGGTWQSAGTATSGSLTGLSCSASYTVEVQARDTVGYGASGSSTLTTPDGCAPSAPGTPTFSSVSYTTANVSWPAASDNVGITGYRYFLNGAEQPALGNVTSVSLSNLGAGKQHTFAIQARDAAGNWGNSASASFTTLMPTITLPASYSFSSSGTAKFWLLADGNLWHNVSGGIGQDFGDWLSPKAGMSSFEVLATAQEGTDCRGTFDTWVPFDRDRDWLAQGVGKYCKILFQIRRIDTTTVLGSGTIRANAT